MEKVAQMEMKLQILEAILEMQVIIVVMKKQQIQKENFQKLLKMSEKETIFQKLLLMLARQMELQEM